MKLNQYFTIYLLCTLNSGIKVSPMFINFNFFTYPMPFLKALRLLNLVSKIRKKKKIYFFFSLQKPQNSAQIFHALRLFKALHLFFFPGLIFFLP